jgi:hypothetical protein
MIKTGDNKSTIPNQGAVGIIPREVKFKKYDPLPSAHSFTTISNHSK